VRVVIAGGRGFIGRQGVPADLRVLIAWSQTRGSAANPGRRCAFLPGGDGCGLGSRPARPARSASWARCPGVGPGQVRETRQGRGHRAPNGHQERFLPIIKQSRSWCRIHSSRIHLTRFRPFPCWWRQILVPHRRGAIGLAPRHVRRLRGEVAGPRQERAARSGWWRFTRFENRRLQRVYGKPEPASVARSHRSPV